jgi:hypothetical protein
MSDTKKSDIIRTDPHENGTPSWLEIVREQVSSLRFGTVLITVHDSRVVQVERLEKLRFDNNTRRP